jgi:peroxiredoxin
MKKTVLLILAVFLLFMTAQLIFQHGEPEATTSTPENIFASTTSKLRVGSLAPDFSLPDIKGTLLKLRQEKGRQVVLNFWSIDCAPCVEEIPLLQQMTDRAPDGLIVIAINMGDTETRIESFIKSNKITYTVLQDSDGKVSNLYHIAAYPVTYFIDRDGIIQDQHTGQLTSGILPTYLEKIGITSW